MARSLRRRARLGSTTLVLFSVLLLIVAAGVAQAQCLTQENIRRLDAGFDEALLHGSIDFFEQNLHPEFVWVHNHASSIERSRDDRLTLMRERASAGRINAQRTQADVSVVLAGQVAVVYGFTDVERTAGFVERTGARRRLRYHWLGEDQGPVE